ncbi:MAG TPA: RNA methyltransferase [Terracidiphilus sp.]|nr:RNA methyltransferase [Terracidiphilus sp.]
MPVRIVQSKQNARLKDLRRALAAPGRKAGRVAGIEGPNLVVEALRAGLKIDCVFVAESMQKWVEALRLPAETEVLIVPSGILTAILATETPQPVAALVEPFAWIWRDLLEPDDGRLPLILVLAGVQDPGNLGTILRSAEAFGATGVVSLPGTVQAWNAKAVRASAGSVFRVPVLAASAQECFARLRDAGVTIRTTAARGTEPAGEANLKEPVAFVIGNEGNGVREELAARADGGITIPCPGPVESLNAAVAASVLLYEAARQRGALSNSRSRSRPAAKKSARSRR